MKMHRVYLHNLLWDQDSLGFLNRLNTYLDTADKYKIKTLFVLLDDVWHPLPKLGKQPDPTHSFIIQDGCKRQGLNFRRFSPTPRTKNYIKGVVSHFAQDSRVIGWDLYNEPDNVATQPEYANWN